MWRLGQIRINLIPIIKLDPSCIKKFCIKDICGLKRLSVQKKLKCHPVVSPLLLHCKPFDCKNYRYSLCYISDCSFTALSAVDHCMQWYTVVKLVNSQNLHSFKYDTCIIWMLSLAFSAVCTCIFWSHIRQITKMSSFIFCHPSTVVSIT